MLTPNDYMELEYGAILKEGVTLSGQKCPKCKGSGCLSVSKVNKMLLWFCHRASCDFRKGGKVQDRLRDSTPDAREIEYPDIETLPADVRKKLQQNYHLKMRSINRADISLAPNFMGGDRLFMPVKYYDGTLRGFNAKALDKTVKPKSVLKTTTQSAIAWYPNTTQSRKVLVVEDQLSAIRAADYFTAVSILGTNLNDERIDEILSFKPSRIYLALDHDAFHKAIRFMQEFRTKTDGRLKMVRIRMDVKDMPEDIFQDFIMESCNN